LTFISGTAAIKGHASVAPDRLQDQITCTLDNLRLISRAAGLGDRLGAGSGATRHFKVYLRHPSDLAAAQAALAGSLLGPEDRVVWLQADLCRLELAIEIEATVIGA
jgi:enamine deaminase RidA (YjgF/YER057c/UK114 family)